MAERPPSSTTTAAPAREHTHLLSRRTSFRRSLTDNAALPAEFLERLEEKRKQLDDSIHKYIAAKERDYKVFERELRNEHRIAQGQAGVPTTLRKRSSREGVKEDGRSRGRSKEQGDLNEAIDEALDRAAITGLQDRRCSVERDKDFVGLFTPAFLPAIDDSDARELERTTSEPPPPTLASLGIADGNAPRQGRSNSDSIIQAKPKRPSQLVLAHRTSSSGSSADGRLTSAMKSPSHPPKRKRVSLALGNTIVAPSDNVPAIPSTSKTPSHSRHRSSIARRELTLLSHETTQSSSGTSPPTQAPTPADLLVGTSPRAQSLLTLTQSTTIPSTVVKGTPTPGKLDPDGDLFDLLDAEEEDTSNPGNGWSADDLDNRIDSEDDEDDDLFDPPTSPLDDDVLLTPAKIRYDSTTGLIPKPSSGIDSAVPYLTSGSVSSVSSQQPINSGFRRPSVISDPVYRGEDYDVVEQDAVENEIYGSKFTDPASKSSFTAGSLGESYMAAHAAEMMRTRKSLEDGDVEANMDDWE